MPFLSSVFPPAPYHPMAAGHLIVRCPCLAHRRLLLVLGGIALASCRLFDSRRTGREAGRLLAWLLWRGSSIDVYNEYDVCDVYKRYKDTRIQGYKDTRIQGYIE